MLYLITLTSLLISVKSQVDTCAFTPPNPCPATLDETCCVVNNGGTTSGDVVLAFANECYAACSNAENKLPSECGTCCTPNATPSQCATGDTCTQLGNFAYCQTPTPDPCAGECDDSANPCGGRTGQTSTCEVNQADANKCRHCTYVCDTFNNYCAFGSSDCDSTLGLACQQQTNSPNCGQCTCTLTGWCTDSNACTTAPNTECVRVINGQPCGECMDPCWDAECKGDSECTGGLTGQTGTCTGQTTMGCKKCEYTTTCDTTAGVNCQTANHCTISPNTECVFNTNSQCGECMDPCRNAECTGDSECTGGLAGQTGACVDDTSTGCKKCEYTTTCDTTAGINCITSSHCTISPNTECVFNTNNQCGVCMDPCRDAECKGDSECIGGPTGSAGTCTGQTTMGCKKCEYTTTCDTTAGVNCQTANHCTISPNTECVFNTNSQCGECMDPCREAECTGDSECIGGLTGQTGTCIDDTSIGCKKCAYECDVSAGYFSGDGNCGTGKTCVFQTTPGTTSPDPCCICQDPCDNAECTGDSECTGGLAGQSGACVDDTTTGCKKCEYTTTCDTTAGINCQTANHCTISPNTECVFSANSQCGECMDPCRNAECAGDSECTGGLTGQTGTCDTTNTNTLGCNQCVYSCTNGCNIGGDDCATPEECVSGVTNSVCGECQCKTCDEDVDCTTTAGIIGLCVDKNVNGCGVCKDICYEEECAQDANCQTGFECNDDANGCGVCQAERCTGVDECLEADDCDTSIPEKCSGADDTTCGKCETDNCPNGCEEDNDCATGDKCQMSSTTGTVAGCGECVFDDGTCYDDSECDDGYSCRFDHWFGCTPRAVSSANGVVPTTMCQGICVNNAEYCDAVRVKDYWPSFWKNSAGVAPNGASSAQMGNLCEFCLCTETGERTCEYVVTWENVANTLGMDVVTLVELFNKNCDKDQFTDLKDETGEQCDYVNVGVKDVEDIKYCGCTVFYCKGGTYVSINGANQVTMMVGIVFVMVMFWWM